MPHAPQHLREYISNTYFFFLFVLWKKMPFTEFPYGPQLPPHTHMQDPTALGASLPLHPLLRPLPTSRPYESPTDARSPRDHNIQHLLHAERCAHRRTHFTLRNELSRRDQLEQQIVSTRKECQALAMEWSTATKHLMQCDTERLELAREVQALRLELEGWKVVYKEMHSAVGGLFGMSYVNYTDCPQAYEIHRAFMSRYVCSQGKTTGSQE
jgi:hypothetical protein